MTANLECPELSKIVGILRINDFSLQKCVSEKLKNAYATSGLGDSFDIADYKAKDIVFPEVGNDKLV